jgi:hypothetical protein
MPSVAQPYKPKNETGLTLALLYEDGYGHWGWWCTDRACSPGADVLGKEGFKSRDTAREAAKKHEQKEHRDGLG